MADPSRYQHDGYANSDVDHLPVQEGRVSRAQIRGRTPRCRVDHDDSNCSDYECKHRQKQVDVPEDVGLSKRGLSQIDHQSPLRLEMSSSTRGRSQPFTAYPDYSVGV
jgi:hypothetical protein